MVQQVSPYGIGTTLDLPFAEAIVRVKERFQAEGFGVLSEIDIQKALREKIGEEIEPYTILGMCNPRLASAAIATEHPIGLLLPCNVLVHECGGTVHVDVQDPSKFAEITGNPAMGPIGTDVRARLERALESLAH